MAAWLCVRDVFSATLKVAVSLAQVKRLSPRWELLFNSCISPLYAQMLKLNARWLHQQPFLKLIIQLETSKNTVIVVHGYNLISKHITDKGDKTFKYIVKRGWYVRRIIKWMIISLTGQVDINSNPYWRSLHKYSKSTVLKM